jgi:DNA-binding transcriptional LysR family regulator
MSVDGAEQLHFGRAAEALHIAQPVLSRQIRALEDELKTQLFVRDKRATELTPAGRQLLADAGPLLASADALRRRVARAARGPGSFTVAFMPGLIVTGAIRALTARHPQVAVNVLRTNWHDQTDVLHDGQADVSYVRLPVDQAGLHVQPLLTEPRVAALPAGHRLAGKDTVTIADLAGEHLLQDPAAVPEWRDTATEMRSRRRQPAPAFRTVEEKLEHVAAGHGIVPRSRPRCAVKTSRQGRGQPREACRVIRAAARSRRLTTPQTSRPSITGRCRKPCSSMSWSASSIVVSGDACSGSLVIHADTGEFVRSLPDAAARSTSRSVRIPARKRLCKMSADPTFCLTMAAAADATGSSGLVVTTRVVMTSRTVSARPGRLGS